MITKTNTTLNNLKNLFIEIFLDKTNKVSNVADGSVLNATAFGVAKIAQKAMKDIAIKEAQIFPESSSGEYLDKCAALYGVSARKSALGSSTYIRVYAAPNTVYDETVTFVNKNGIRFQVEKPLVVGPTGYGYVSVRSTSVGYATNVAPNSITTVTPQPIGHIECTNEYYAIGGRDSEDDETFRIRIENNNNLYSKGTLEYFTQILQNEDDRVLKVMNVGLDENGFYVLYIVSQNGIYFTESELETLLNKIQGYFNITDLNVEGNVVGIVLKNAEWFFVGSERGIDFRLELDPNYNIETVRKNIQVALTKYLDFRFWKSGSIVEWDSLLDIVRKSEGVKYVPDQYFFPYYDEQVPTNQLPRIRGFIMRDKDGNVLFDASDTLSPLFYPQSDENEYRGITNTSLALLQSVYFTIIDENGNPIENARISIGSNSIITNSQGQATISLTNGTYDYVVSKNQYEQYTGNFIVLNAPVTIEVTLNFSPYKVIFSVKDENDLSVSGATVLINNKSLTTNINGVAETTVKNGTYPYTINKLGYEQITGKSVVVNNANENVNEVMYLYAWNINFFIKDKNNKPIPGVVVKIGENSYLTNDQGQSIVNLVNGTYRVSFEKIGYISSTENITVLNRDEIFNFTLDFSKYNVTFNVKEELTNKPIQSALVSITGTTLKELTNSQGQVTFSLINGNYSYIITNKKYDNIQGNFNVLNQDLSINTLMSFKHYNVIFNILDQNGNPIKDAILDINGQTKTTDDNGQAIVLLQDGTYSYTVTKIGFDNLTGNVIVNGFDISETLNMTPKVWEILFNVINSSGVAVEGANINIFGQYLTTNSQGQATISLTNGTYPYTINKTGYNNLIGDLVVSNKNEEIPITLTFFEYNVIFSVEWSGVAVEGATITVGDKTALTNSGGIASMKLTNGSYDYSATKSGYIQSTGNFVVLNEDQTVNVEIIPQSYNITFNVKDDNTTTPNNLQGATIEINNQTLTTDINGTASILLYANTYPVTYTLNGYVKVNTTIDVTQVETFVQVLKKIWLLDFAVSAATRAALEGVTIDVTGDNIIDSPKQLITNTEGKTEKIQVTNGTYNWSAHKTGYSPEEGVGEIKDADSTNSNIALTFGFETIFNVKSNNIPLSGVDITIDNITTITTDEQGTATINLSTGNHVWTVNQSGYLTATGNIIVGEATQTIDISLVVGGKTTFKAISNQLPVADLQLEIFKSTIVPKVGDFVYSDKTWSTTLNPDKTCIGVIARVTPRSFDVMSIESGNLKWGSDFLVTDIVTTTIKSEASLDFEGKSNTEKIVSQLGVSDNNASLFCDNFSVEGFPQGSWYLPALGQLVDLYQNIDTLNESLLKIAVATPLMGATYYLSSTQYDYDSAWLLFTSNTNTVSVGVKSAAHAFRIFSTIVWNLNALEGLSNENNTKPLAIDDSVYNELIDTITTNDQGEATIDLENGTYSYKTSKVGFKSTEEIMFAVEGVDKIVEIDLTNYQYYSASYLITLLFGSGNVDGATVTLYKEDKTTIIETKTVVDATTSVLFENLINGIYFINVAKEGYWFQKEYHQITVLNSNINNVLSISNIYNVTFTLKDSKTNNPIVGAVVSLVDDANVAENEIKYQGTTNEQGIAIMIGVDQTTQPSTGVVADNTNNFYYSIIPPAPYKQVPKTEVIIDSDKNINLTLKGTESVTFNTSSMVESTQPTFKPKVGDFVYSDKTWSTTLNPDKNCVGVITRVTPRSFDVIAVGSQIGNDSKRSWGDNSAVVENLPEITDVSLAIADMDGRGNTTKMIEWGLSRGVSMPAAEFCNNFSVEGFSQGSWYLPSFGQLYDLQRNALDKVVASIAASGKNWTNRSGTWSSTQRNYWQAWGLNLASTTTIYPEESKMQSKIITPYTTIIWNPNIPEKDGSYIMDVDGNFYTKDEWINYTTAPNGIYVVDSENNYYTKAEWTALSTKPTVNGIGIVSGDHKFIFNPDVFDPNSIWGGATLVSNIITTTNQETAITDFNGKNNTVNISVQFGLTSSAGRCYNFIFPNGQRGYFGTAGEWSTMFENKTEIDELLTILGKSAISENYIWTSTQYNDQRAWLARWSNTSFNNGQKNIDYYPLYVFTDFIAKEQRTPNGVAVINGSNGFVVSMDTTDPKLAYSTTTTLVSGITTTTDSAVAITDFNGKSNTDQLTVQLGSSVAMAADYCNKFIFPNNQRGYLPAAGEWSIVSNSIEFYYCLYLLGGALKNRDSDFYLTSTQVNNTNNWVSYPYTKAIQSSTKTLTTGYVRPFADFILPDGMKEEGVYIQDTDHNLYTEDEWNALTTKPTVNGIAILDSRNSLVLRKDNPSTQYNWGVLDEFVPNVTSASSSESAKANADYGGRYNTNGIIAKYGSASNYAAPKAASYTFPNGGIGYLPAKGQLNLIFDYRLFINNLLTTIGGNTIPDGWSWSSTQGSTSGREAWCVSFPSGDIAQTGAKNVNMSALSVDDFVFKEQLPLSGVTITSDSVSGITDSQGQTILELPSGQDNPYLATKGGYLDYNGQTGIIEGPTTINILMETAISLIVTVRSNNSSGNPIPNLIVKLESITEGVSYTRSLKTSSSGIVLFDNCFKNTTYKISTDVQASGLETSYENITPLDVSLGESEQNLSIYPIGLYKINNTVYRQNVVAPNKTINLLSIDDSANMSAELIIKSVVTDESGKGVFTGIKSGNYKQSVDATDYTAKYIGTQFTVSGDENVEINLSPLYDLVFRTNFEGATIDLTGDFTATATTGVDGSYTFKRVPFGTIGYTVSKEGYETVTATSFNIEGTTDSIEIEVNLQKAPLVVQITTNQIDYVLNTNWNYVSILVVGRGGDAASAGGGGGTLKLLKNISITETPIIQEMTIGTRAAGNNTSIKWNDTIQYTAKNGLNGTSTKGGDGGGGGFLEISSGGGGQGFQSGTAVYGGAGGNNTDLTGSDGSTGGGSSGISGGAGFAAEGGSLHLEMFNGTYNGGGGGYYGSTRGVAAGGGGGAGYGNGGSGGFDDANGGNGGFGAGGGGRTNASGSRSDGIGGDGIIVLAYHDELID